MLNNLADLVSDYVTRMSSDEVSSPNAGQLRRDEMRISTLMTREERRKKDDASNPLFALRRKRKRIELGIEILADISGDMRRYLYDTFVETPQFVGNLMRAAERYRTSADIRNEDELSLLRNGLPEQAEDIVSEIEKAMKEGVVDEESMYSLFQKGRRDRRRNTFPWGGDDYYRSLPFQILCSLLIVKAVEMGTELAYSALTDQGQMVFPQFNPLFTDVPEFRSDRISHKMFTFLSDMREGETLLQMATRIWGEDETKASFLDVVRDTTATDFDFDSESSF